MNKIVILLTLLTSIADILLKYSEIIKLDFLSTPRFSLNLLEIIIIILVIFLIYRFLPQNINRLYLHSRARKFYINWKQFKNILVRYQCKAEPALQKKYAKIREKLLNDFGLFLPVIKKIYGQNEDIPLNVPLNNLKNCLLVNEVKDWFKKTSRNVPEELDCFDCFIVSIEGYYKNL